MSEYCFTSSIHYSAISWQGIKQMGFTNCTLVENRTRSMCVTRGHDLRPPLIYLEWMFRNNTAFSTHSAPVKPGTETVCCPMIVFQHQTCNVSKLKVRRWPVRLVCTIWRSALADCICCVTSHTTEDVESTSFTSLSSCLVAVCASTMVDWSSMLFY